VGGDATCAEIVPADTRPNSRCRAALWLKSSVLGSVPNLPLYLGFFALWNWLAVPATHLYIFYCNARKAVPAGRYSRDHVHGIRMDSMSKPLT
jgi:hypothetical protein